MLKLNFILLITILLAGKSKAADSPPAPHPVCSFRPPTCTPEDDLRAASYQRWLKIDSFPPGLYVDFVNILQEIPGQLPCMVNQLSLYDEHSCSEMDKIRGCLIEKLITGNCWNKPLPKRLQRIFKSMSEKDKFVPSDELLKKLSHYVGQPYLPKCLFENFKKIRYCEPPCPQCKGAV